MFSGAGVAEASEELLELLKVVDGVCMAEDSFALEALHEGVDVFSCRRVDLLGVEAIVYRVVQTDLLNR